MFLISPDLGNELFLCFSYFSTMKRRRRCEFVYFDVKMIWLTDRLLMLSRTPENATSFVCKSVHLNAFECSAVTRCDLPFLSIFISSRQAASFILERDFFINFHRLRCCEHCRDRIESIIKCNSRFILQEKLHRRHSASTAAATKN